MLGVVLCGTISLRGIFVKVKEHKKVHLPLQGAMFQGYAADGRTVDATRSVGGVEEEIAGGDSLGSSVPSQLVWAQSDTLIAVEKCNQPQEHYRHLTRHTW